MTKYEYCQVELDKKIERIADELIFVPTDKKVQAKDGKKVIAQASTYLEVFNRLGANGWRLKLSIDNEIFYFERETRDK